MGVVVAEQVQADPELELRQERRVLCELFTQVH
jgi:hypothetical protein